MAEREFKVGDKVIFTSKDKVYDFGGEIGIVKKGDIVTISSVGMSHGGSCYGVKESYTKDRPNWLDMERFFKLLEVDERE
jgi:hypothetical protein